MGPSAATAWVLWWRRHPALTDLALTLAVIAVIWTQLAYIHETGARPMDARGAALAVGCALPILARRRYPVGALLVSTGLTFGYHLLNYSGGVPLPATWVLLYSAALAGRAGAAYLVAAWHVSGATWYRAVVEGDDLLSIGVEAAAIVAATMGGTIVRTRRALQAEVATRLARQAEADARQRAVQERLWIAREVHDVVAHTLTGIGVHASAIVEALDRGDPATAARSAREIRSASTESLAELRGVLSGLREGPDDAELAPPPGLDRLDDLARGAAAHGLRVDLDVSAAGLGDDGDSSDGGPAGAGTTVTVSPGLSRAAYRVVQEALTNVARHAGASVALVRVAPLDGGLGVEVTDDGRGIPSGRDVLDGGAGHGLAGMRERVEAFGGRLEAGGLDGGGFRVRAWFPAA